MDKSQTEIWSQIWREQLFKPIEIDGKITTWNQLVWKVGLEFLYEIYKKAKGNLVLECGCGAANDSLYLAKRGFQIMLLDYSSYALEHARKNFLYFQKNGIFIIGDVEKLPFKNNVFDVVTSAGLLEHFKDVWPPIKEMARILKPKGLFVATIVTKRCSVQTIGNIEGFCARFLKRLFMFRFKNIIEESLINTPVYENSFSKKIYEEIMKKAGLINVKITGSAPFPYLALLPWMEKIYVKILQKLLWFWKWFDRSELKFTDWWGISWYARGFKNKVF